jgi:hypothetical protein
VSEFSQSLQAATQALVELARRAEASGQALADESRQRRQGAAGVGGVAKAGLAAGGLAVAGVALGGAYAYSHLAAGARAGASQIGSGLGFAARGDFEAAAGQIGLASLAAVDQLSIAGLPVGRIFSEASGLKGLERTLAGTQGRVEDVTLDLARYGIDVAPDFRQRLVDEALEQERRVEVERKAVAGAVGAAAPSEALAQAEQFMGRLEGLLKRIADRIESFTGGGAR